LGSTGVGGKEENGSLKLNYQEKALIVCKF